eukprot:Hpha_TRINITY_DN15797_c0_g3::TRINITY_DN15797_c0_g3_i1::g.41790::m.41790/K14640/SLC20A, PIT; solute carrier family 20 (sodium-dependent phosphate transporter)
MEFSGALLMGDSVTKTIKGKIIRPDDYMPPQREERVELMIGFLSVEIATALWLILATYFRLPVSTTHTVIGGLLGFGLSTHHSAVVWSEVIKICVAWVTAPILAAISGATCFVLVRTLILRHDDPYRHVCRWMWLVICFCLTVAFAFLTVKSPPDMESAFNDAFGKVDTAKGFFTRIAISFGAALLVSIPAHFFIVPRLRKSVDDTPAGAFPWSRPVGDSENALELPSPGAAGEVLPLAVTGETAYGVAVESKAKDRSSARLSRRSFHDDDGKYHPPPTGGAGGLEAAHAHEDVVERANKAELFDERAEGLFSYLQVLTACFFSFAHGASDTANAIGPLVAIWALYKDGEIGDSGAPVWILVIGGGGLVVGLCLWGWRIIAAIGVEMIKITPARGFSIEMGAAIIVMVSTVLGIPTSTTHCAVGSTVGCGLLEGRRDAINVKLLVKIFCGWGVTLVISASTSAAVYHLLNLIIC